MPFPSYGLYIALITTLGAGLSHLLMLHFSHPFSSCLLSVTHGKSVLCSHYKGRIRQYSTCLFPTAEVLLGFSGICCESRNVKPCVLSIALYNRLSQHWPLKTRVNISCSPGFCGAGIQEQAWLGGPALGVSWCCRQARWLLLECGLSASPQLSSSTGLCGGVFKSEQLSSS